jgi:hypothetical protein
MHRHDGFYWVLCPPDHLYLGAPGKWIIAQYVGVTRIWSIPGDAEDWFDGAFEEIDERRIKRKKVKK